MGKRVSPTLIGAFVVGAAALAAVAIMVWGSGRLFQRTHTYVCYFPGSVNGLNRGAPVKFRGVQVGEVADIRLRYEQVLGEPRIPVFLDLDEDRMRELGAERAPTREVVEQFIADGLRARLQTLSLVTGVLYVDFDLLPESPVTLVQRRAAPVPEIPTLPTTLEEATASVSEVLAELKAIDFRRIGRDVNETVAGMKRLVRTPELRAAIEALPELVASTRSLVAELRSRTGPLATSAQATADETRRAAETLRTALEEIRALVAPDAPLPVELTRTVADLGNAARALRDLADYLERNPSAVVFGKGTEGR